MLASVFVLHVCLTPALATARVTFNDGAIHIINDDTYAAEAVWVYNEGCSSNTCPEPGAPTEVIVAEGGDIMELEVYQTSTAIVSGGIVSGKAISRNSGLITLNGTGWIDDMAAQEGGSLVLNSSTAACRVMRALGSVSVQVLAGEITTWLYTSGDASLDLSGGSLGSLSASSDSIVELDGIGVTGQIQVTSGAVVDWSAGGSATRLYAWDVGTRIRVHGSEFAVNGVPVPFGDLPATTGTLTGLLESEEEFSVQFFQGGYDSGAWTTDGVIEVVAVPEPSLALGILTALITLTWIRQRRT